MGKSSRLVFKKKYSTVPTGRGELPLRWWDYPGSKDTSRKGAGSRTGQIDSGQFCQGWPDFLPLLPVSQGVLLAPTVLFSHRNFLTMTGRWFSAEGEALFLWDASSPALSSCSSKLFSLWPSSKDPDLPLLHTGSFWPFPSALGPLATLPLQVVST